MVWFFRKSKKVGPVRITASKTGVSLSTGRAGVRQTVSSTGRRTTTFRIPGAGISWRRSRKG